MTEAPELTRAEARLPRWMILCGIVGVAAAAFSGHLRFAAGTAVGAVLGILNYYWLHQAVGTLFDAGGGRLPKRIIAKFIVRYPLAFGAVYLFYRTGWLPFTAILAGLFAPVGGALIEAVAQIGEGLKDSSG